jgi:tRNA G18 (ribose-2'-O)-methylase SpoU
METRCPYPDCQKIWQIDAGSHQLTHKSDHVFLRAVCTVCQRPATLKPLAVLEQIDRKSESLRLQGVDTAFSWQEKPGDNFCAVLEDIRSLQNIGSMFRTADALCLGSIYLTGISGIPTRKDVLKTSLGAEEHIAWQFHPGSLAVLEQMKRLGIFLVALERNSQSVDIVTLRPPQLKTPLCLVLGNEVFGVSEEALAACDVVCHIAMQGAKESLNVAVAFGIAVYQIKQVLAGAR